MPDYVAEVFECPFEAGRWLVIRRSRIGSSVYLVSCPSRDAAETASRGYQREFDHALNNLPSGQLRLPFFADDPTP